MPRGLCENCGRHDVFVYPVPLAFGRTVFVCARCLNLPQAPLEDDEDQDDDWECVSTDTVAKGVFGTHGSSRCRGDPTLCLSP